MHYDKMWKMDENSLKKVIQRTNKRYEKIMNNRYAHQEYAEFHEYCRSSRNVIFKHSDFKYKNELICAASIEVVNLFLLSSKMISQSQLQNNTKGFVQSVVNTGNKIWNGVEWMAQQVVDATTTFAPNISEAIYTSSIEKSSFIGLTAIAAGFALARPTVTFAKNTYNRIMNKFHNVAEGICNRNASVAKEKLDNANYVLNTKQTLNNMSIKVPIQ